MAIMESRKNLLTPYDEGELFGPANLLSVTDGFHPSEQYSVFNARSFYT